jgi:peptide/nickel transport system permease protein
VLFAGLAGTAIGVLSGYHRGLLDDVVMRLVDLQMSFPILLIALVVLYVLGPGLWNLVFVLAITRWTIYARVSRGMVLADREQLFVEAARASGAGDRRIILRHLLPNLAPTLLVLATLEAASLMLAEATLSFLGLGLPLAEPSWGQMLATGRPYITNAWWLITFPGLAILFTVLSLNLIGVWARRVMDPVGR